MAHHRKNAHQADEKRRENQASNLPEHAERQDDDRQAAQYEGDWQAAPLAHLRGDHDRPRGEMEDVNFGAGAARSRRGCANQPKIALPGARCYADFPGSVATEKREPPEPGLVRKRYREPVSWLPVPTATADIRCHSATQPPGHPATTASVVRGQQGGSTMNVETTIRRSLLLAAMCTAGQAGMASADDDASVATACLRRSDIRTTKILDDRNVLFITRDRITYSNQLTHQCPGMRRNSAMSFTYANNGKLCAGSTFTVLYRTAASTNTTPYTNPATNEHIALQGPPFVVGPTCQLGLFGPVSEDELKVLMAATEEPKRSRRRGDQDAVKTEAIQTSPAPARPAAK
jgi:hypothetical protein